MVAASGYMQDDNVTEWTDKEARLPLLWEGDTNEGGLQDVGDGDVDDDDEDVGDGGHDKGDKDTRSLLVENGSNEGDIAKKYELWCTIVKAWFWFFKMSTEDG